jgi:probable phosphoglycerate mutase
MKMLLVRHGESVSNAATDSISLPDDEGDRLSELGWEQARAAGEALRPSGVTQIIASPMRRARETATAIAEQIGFDPEDIETDEEIYEVREAPDYGTLPVEKQHLLRWSARMTAHPDDPDHTGGVDGDPGGESFNSLRNRARSFGERMTERDPAGKPLVVTHGIFLRFFLMDSILGDAFNPGMAERLWWARTVNCGVSVFEHDEPYAPLDPPREGWVCASWMERPWAAP